MGTPKWRLTILCGLLLSGAKIFAADTAQNWPQWRGPLCNGVSPTGHPPTEWSEEKNIKWKIKVPGTGSATPVVWGDKVFIETAVSTGNKPESQGEAKDDSPPRGGGSPGRGGGRGGFGQKPTEVYQWVFLCLDRQTGQELWKKVVREEVPHEGVMPNEGNYAACSPVTDGEHVYAFFGSRGLYCFDMNGNQKWDKDFGKMRIKLTFGEGSSPALYENKLIVNWDHEGDSFIAAFDKRTGDELWRTSRNEKTTWGTPLVVSYQGQTQVIVPSSGKIRSYDLADGKPIWECGGLTANSIPSPVEADGVVYLTTGYQGPVMLAIQLGHTGDSDRHRRRRLEVRQRHAVCIIATAVRRQVVFLQSVYQCDDVPRCQNRQPGLSDAARRRLGRRLRLARRRRWPGIFGQPQRHFGGDRQRQQT